MASTGAPLSVASLAVQSFADVETLGGDAPISLFCLTIAESGERKACRIAAILTLVKDLNSSEIPEDMMTCGVELAEYYLQSAKRLTEAGTISPATARAEKLRLWLLDEWLHDEIVPSEILRLGPSSLRESSLLRPAVALLLEHGWLTPLPEGMAIRGASRKTAYGIERREFQVA